MNGWGACDGFQDTIESIIDDAIDWARLEIELKEKDQSLDFCLDCDEPIPEQRKIFSKGCKYCVHCQKNYDIIATSSYNRRASKDSQLR